MLVQRARDAMAARDEAESARRQTAAELQTAQRNERLARTAADDAEKKAQGFAADVKRLAAQLDDLTKAGSEGAERIRTALAQVERLNADLEKARAEAADNLKRAADAAASAKQAEQRALDAEAQAKTAEAAKRAAEDRAGRRSQPPFFIPPEPVDIASRRAVPLTAAEAAALKPGDEFQECAECPRMVTIPAGTFVMGSSDGKTPVVGLDGKPKPAKPADAEADRSSDEGPQHEVRIGRFAAGKFTVTFDEWEACVKGGGCQTAKSPDARGWGTGKRPVINVSWNDANAYVDWINEKKLGGKKVYRLLTEAEWEYAARAGTATRYFWGDSLIKNRANCNGCGSEWDGEKTAPVGSFKPNDFGLHDMHGNVWQWTQDCYVDNYTGAPQNGDAVSATRDCGRVIRGGSWFSGPGIMRSAFRGRLSTGSQSDILGFRVARTF